jgi:hypothetical protein
MIKWTMSTLTYLILFAGIAIKIKSVMSTSKNQED